MMRGLIGLLKGWPGKPSHPPLTDASIGAYTVGVAMLVLGALGVEEEPMAHGSLLAIGGGLALALPTALTGLLDWLDIPKGTPTRTIATVHLFTMLTATVLFAVAFVGQLDGYEHGQVKTCGAGLRGGRRGAGGGRRLHRRHDRLRIREPGAQAAGHTGPRRPDPRPRGPRILKPLGIAPPS